MHRRTKQIAALIVILLLLTACGTSDELPAETTAAVSTTASSPTTDSVTVTAEEKPQITYAQTYARYGVTVLRQIEKTSSFAELGELISAGEAARDAAVELVLDVELTREMADDMPAEAVRRVQAGENPDLLEFSAADDAASLAPGGYLADLSGLPTLALDHPAYERTLIDELTVAGHTYFLFGAATVADKAATAVLFLNVAAASGVGLEIEPLLDEVRMGNWTVERLLSYIQTAAGAFDKDAIVPLFLGSGGKIFDRDAEGMPILTTGDTFSRAYAAMQQVMAASTALHDDTVFTAGTLDDLERGQIAIPQPLLSSGDRYLLPVDPEKAGCVAIPAAPSDPTRTGDLLNAYFVEAIEPIAEPLRESLAADTDKEILDAILDSRTCALGALFGWGDLADALRDSAGIPEDDFLAASTVRMTAAARAMEIFVSRLK